MLKIEQGNIPDFNFKQALKKPIPIRCFQMKEPFKVETLEGIMLGKKGDWLMVGVTGEMYPCDQKIFNLTYDLKIK
ncbi:hypothetical protein A9Q87_08030 [Flavobacteriales bacterium 34_180_T64]|nr:hypothetical protein A9Q87_08030 [Flavobacteriales bacterium 34_180_T64]